MLYGKWFLNFLLNLIWTDWTEATLPADENNNLDDPQKFHQATSSYGFELLFPDGGVINPIHFLNALLGMPQSPFKKWTPVKKFNHVEQKRTPLFVGDQHISSSVVGIDSQTNRYIIEMHLKEQGYDFRQRVAFNSAKELMQSSRVGSSHSLLVTSVINIVFANYSSTLAKNGYLTFYHKKELPHLNNLIWIDMLQAQEQLKSKSEVVETMSEVDRWLYFVLFAREQCDEILQELRKIDVNINEACGILLTYDYKNYIENEKEGKEIMSTYDAAYKAGSEDTYRKLVSLLRRKNITVSLETEEVLDQ